MTIHDHAVELAREHGIINLTRKMICDAVGVSERRFNQETGGITALTNTLSAEHPDLKRVGGEVKRRSINPALRREHILTSAVAAATENGYYAFTRDDVAEIEGCSPSLVTRYYQTMPQLRRAVMRHAIRNEVLPVIANGVVNKCPHAMKASEELRERALRSLK